MIIQREALCEAEIHRFTAFASDLHIPAGTWPDWLEVKPSPFGNGHILRRTAVSLNASGDVERVRYEQINGCIVLNVFND